MPALPIDDLPPAESGGSDRFNQRQIGRRKRWATGLATVILPHTHRSLRVLIADPNHDIVDVLVVLVKRWGHEAWGTYDGAEALELALRIAPDVVLTEPVLPLLNGFDLCRQIRRDGRDGCFLIALAAEASGPTRQRCADAGLDLVLLKPVDGLVLQALFMLEADRLGLLPLKQTALRSAAEIGVSRTRKM